jgi:peroxiredoxin
MPRGVWVRPILRHVTDQGAKAEPARTDPRLTHPELRPIFEAGEARWLANWQAGPSRRRWTSLPVQAGDPAPDIELLDEAGRPVRLASLWTERPALLLFWRHWGCGCGTDRAAKLQEEYPRLIEAGANVVVIGQGEPERGAWYRELFKLPCPIVVDGNESAYRAYGLTEMSPWLLLGKPWPGREHFERLIDEHRAKGLPVADNPFLLPGEFVVDRSGRLVLAYRYQYCDNYPDTWTLVDSIAEAVAAG